jgi:hypothetical protein
VPRAEGAVWVFPKSFLGDYKHVGRRLAQSTRANIVARLPRQPTLRGARRRRRPAAAEAYTLRSRNCGLITLKTEQFQRGDDWPDSRDTCGHVVTAYLRRVRDSPRPAGQ